jgi:hypothetical protein
MIDVMFASNAYDLVKKINQLNEKIDVINIVPTNRGDGYLAFYKVL